MDKLNSGDGRSGSNHGSGEMADAPFNKKLAILNKVDVFAEAIQSLVEGQKQTLEHLLSQGKNENNMECENDAFLSDIFSNVKKIRKVITEEKSSQLPTSQNLSSRFNTNQAEKSFVDIQALAEKALHNSVVLRTIMNNLEVRDLLRCRLVTKSWKVEVDIQLLSGRQSNTVRFEWNEEKEKYKSQRGTLKEFTECCYGDPCRKFPCSNFHIYLRNANTDSKETQADLVNFFSKFGHHIKSLYLECSKNSASALMIFQKIIFEWTPNLQSLSLEYPRSQESREMFDSNDLPQFSCVSLKYLQELGLEEDDDKPGRPGTVFETCRHLVRDILASAPNLQRISDFDLSFLKDISSSGKLRAIKSISIDLNSEVVARFVEFSRARPQLTHIVFDPEDFTRAVDQLLIKDFFSSLQIILELSRLTLKTFHLTHRLHFNPQHFNSLGKVSAYQGVRFVIPILENMEELTLENYQTFSGGEGWILPRGTSFQKSFPRLKILRIYSIVNKEGNFQESRADNPLANDFNSSTTVEELNIGSESLFPLEWINQARILYPNIRVLHLDIENCWTEIPHICSRIWKSWNKSSLEELKFVASCYVTYDERDGDFTEIMDQALTGFDKETCRMLRKRPGCENRKGDEGLKRDSSILDMNRLKQFNLAGAASGGFRFFSRVSVIHALDPMKKRQHLSVVINEIELEDMIHEGNVDFFPVFTDQ